MCGRVQVAWYVLVRISPPNAASGEMAIDASVRPCSRCGWSVLLLVQYSLNLSRWVAWIVKLIDCSRRVVPSMAGLPRSSILPQFAGSRTASGVWWKTPPAIVSAFCEVCVAKNQTRSRTMGPPTTGLIVQTSSMRVGVRLALRASRSESPPTLSALSPWKAKVVKKWPLQSLRPSRGIMLIRTPPVSISAGLAE